MIRILPTAHAEGEHAKRAIVLDVDKHAAECGTCGESEPIPKVNDFGRTGRAILDVFVKNFARRHKACKPKAAP